MYHDLRTPKLPVVRDLDARASGRKRKVEKQKDTRESEHKSKDIHRKMKEILTGVRKSLGQVEIMERPASLQSTNSAGCHSKVYLSAFSRSGRSIARFCSRSFLLSTYSRFSDSTIVEKNTGKLSTKKYTILQQSKVRLHVYGITPMDQTGK